LRDGRVDGADGMMRMMLCVVLACACI
jgi:hypothetical protein